MDLHGRLWFAALVGAAGVVLWQSMVAIASPWVAGDAPLGARQVLAPVAAYMHQCLSDTPPRVGCPWLVERGEAYVSYALHGDPVAGARVEYLGDGRYEVIGELVMAGTYFDGISGVKRAVLTTSSYLLLLAVKGHAFEVYAASSTVGLIPVSVPRAPVLTDVAAQRAVADVFTACLRELGVNCLGNGSDTFIRFTRDPLPGARSDYDGGTGVLHVTNRYEAFLLHGGNVSGTYDAAATADATGVTVAFVAYR